MGCSGVLDLVIVYLFGLVFRQLAYQKEGLKCRNLLCPKASDYFSFDSRCPLCGWPMCSEACAGSPTHQPECRLTRQRGSPITLEVKSSTKAFPLYEAVAIFRCMSLKTTDPDKYKGIMELEGHKEERKRSGR